MLRARDSIDGQKLTNYIAGGLLTSAITLTFNRSDVSEQHPATVTVQVSADLNTWNPADDIPIGPANGTGPNGATYTVDETAPLDAITVTLPKNGAFVKFARIKGALP